jgi:NAD(P)-dependent dehydrogenase (short-subunit alcohol dehydrogenase family)
MFADIMNVNVVGSFRVSRSALPYLGAYQRGRVVNFASVMVFTALPAGRAAYVASKAALIGLTRAQARELGPLGITVNAVAPGAVPTFREANSAEEQCRLDDWLIERQCIKRRGTVDDIAAATAFLASDAASFITGQTLLVDGGWAFA